MTEESNLKSELISSEKINDIEADELQIALEENNQISNGSDLEMDKIIESFEKSGRSCLLRLFESPYCDISMTLNYFFTINQPQIISYIGNKLFSYPPEEITWYLLQLIHMYLHVEHTQKILLENLKSISSTNLNFSLIITWLLEAYLLGEIPVSPPQMSSLRHLLNSILSSRCKILYEDDQNISNLPTSINQQPIDNSIIFFTSERSFITELVLISRRLKVISSKTSRLHRLHSELSTLDRTISNAVYIPFACARDHVIVRIPYKDSSVLNSKEKAPYLVYIEVIEQKDALISYSNFLNLKQEEVMKYFNHKNTSEEASIDLKNYNTEIYRDDKSDDTSNTLHSNGMWKKVTIGKIRENLRALNEPTSYSSFGIDSEDPSASVVSEPWKQKVERIRSSSPFGHIPGWNLYSIIIKYGDDLRQDHLAYQFLKKCKDIWDAENVSLWVRPYAVVITESNAGIIEAITNAVSLHQIKNRTGLTLEEFFRSEYGYNTDSYSEAKKNFIKSLAGYSLFQYIFQVKDRHNGNILLDSEGHIIHIDFGYILGQSPKSISFETSPFKMTIDFVDLMEGEKSDLFQYFKTLLFHGLIALRKHMNQLMILVDILKIGNQFTCLGKNGQNIDYLKSRFHVNLTDEQTLLLINKLVHHSMNSFTTVLYDKFQYYTNGIIS